MRVTSPRSRRSELLSLFRLASLEISNKSGKAFESMQWGIRPWNEKLWQGLCDERHGRCPKPVIGGQTTVFAERPLVVRAFVLRCLSELLVPPSYAHCQGIGECFVYGICCWAAQQRSSLEVRIVLHHLQRFLAKRYTAVWHIHSIVSSLCAKSICINTMLQTCVRQEYLLTQTAVLFPADRMLHPEQKEILEAFNDWQRTPKPHLILYQAPPGSGKTSLFLLLALCVARNRGNQKLIFACASDYVRWQTLQRLRAANLSVDILIRFESPDDHTGQSILLCDLNTAKNLCICHQNSVLVYDEASLTSGRPTERTQLCEHFPSFTILMSSILPSTAWISDISAGFRDTWPEATTSALYARRLGQSVTAFDLQGNIALPHHFGMSKTKIEENQFLMRFYSPKALVAILQERGVDAVDVLFPEDLVSFPRIRAACLRILQPCTTENSGASQPRTKEECVWRQALLFKDAANFTLIFAEDIDACLYAGQDLWQQLHERECEHVTFQGSAVRVAAARRGIASFGQTTDPNYVSYVLDLCEKRYVSWIVCDISAAHGLNLPIDRLFFYSMPSNCELLAHVCGRVGRSETLQDASIYFKNKVDACLAMTSGTPELPDCARQVTQHSGAGVRRSHGEEARRGGVQGAGLGV